MARGRTIAKKAQEAYWVNKKAEAGRLQARKEFRDKYPVDFWLEELTHLLKFWKVDPLKIVAVLGGTVIVHEVIFKTAEFASTIYNQTKDTFIAGLEVLNLADLFGLKQTEETQQMEKALQYVALDWVIAFIISYVAIEHGAELLGTAKTLLGITAIK